MLPRLCATALATGLLTLSLHIFQRRLHLLDLNDSLHWSINLNSTLYSPVLHFEIHIQIFYPSDTICLKVISLHIAQL